MKRLPDYLKAFGSVFADVSVNGNEAALSPKRLPDKHPVEWIFVVHGRKFVEGGTKLDREGQYLEISRQCSYDEIFRITSMQV